jgi:hypothetical protein
MRTIVGLYDAREDAKETIEALVDAGFPRDKISMATQHKRRREGEIPREQEHGHTDREEATSGGHGGVVLAGLGGLLIGLGTVALPGLGMIAAAGPLASLLTGGHRREDDEGLSGALVALGILREEADLYAEGIRRGATLVLVQAQEGQINKARHLMGNYNPIDIEKRSKSWQSQDRNVEPLHEQEDRQGQELAPEKPDLARNAVQADKRAARRHQVRVRTYEIDEAVEEEVLLHQEHIDVDRVTLDRDLERRDLAFDLEGDGVIELLETQEEVILEKRPRVVGQVRIIRDGDAEPQIVRETFRRHEVDAKRIESDQDEVVSQERQAQRAEMDGQPDYDTYEPEFRRHYQRNLAEDGHDFTFYRPAYIYGCRLARREKGRDRGWADIETEARSRWLEANPDIGWTAVSPAVHESYMRCQAFDG